MTIISVDKIPINERENCLKRVKEIFFLCAKNTSFSSKEVQDEFFNTWCGRYITHFPELFFLKIGDKDQIEGYLAGCLDTLSSIEKISTSSLMLFKECFDEYPAHFHINVHPKIQGKGVGKDLTNNYFSLLKEKNIKGVHIISSRDADNIVFYRKVGLNEIEIKDHNGFELLLMGKYC